MGKTLPYRLVLASGSAARRYLLERAGYEFEVKPSNIEEPTGEGFSDPRTLVQHIAWLKAAAAAVKEPADRPTAVLTADSLGWLDGQPVAKPADEADARRILTLLGGREHELWTGVCLWLRPGDLQISWQEKSGVFMKRWSEAELSSYLASGVWQGCSGAYAIAEDGNDPFVQVHSGTITNVMGLPMETLEPILTRLAQDLSVFHGPALP